MKHCNNSTSAQIIGHEVDWESPGVLRMDMKSNLYVVVFEGKDSRGKERCGLGLLLCAVEKLLQRLEYER